MTVNDPWASTAVETTKENVVSEGKVVITLKQSGGYDAPWIVIHADDLEDAKRQASELLNNGLPETVAEAAAKFAATKTGVAPARTQAAPQAAPPAQQSTPPVSEGKTCNHGEMTYRSGDKNGKPWGGWFCPTPKDTPDQCKPIWKKF